MARDAVGRSSIGVPKEWGLLREPVGGPERAPDPRADLVDLAAQDHRDLSMGVAHEDEFEEAARSGRELGKYTKNVDLRLPGSR